MRTVWLSVIFGLAGVALVAGCAPRGTQPAYGTQGYGAQPSAAQGDPTVVCQHACYRYFECKGGTSEPSVGAQCVQDCRGSGVDPGSVQALATADCLTIISAFDGGAPIPGSPPSAGGEAAPAASAQPAATQPAVGGSSQPGTGAAPAAIALDAPPVVGTPATAPNAVPATAPTPAVAAAPASNACPPPGSGQLAQLLVSAPWCHFTYGGGTSGAGSSGTTMQERMVFGVDGRFLQSGSNATQGCWRADGDQLQLTAGGQAYAPLQLQVSRNANGYPIINAQGKEYYTCN